MSEKSKNVSTPVRDYWFDNIKGILMILVVVGHMTAQMAKLSHVINTLYYGINIFHMCAFMIVTGYLSKRRIDSKDYISIINKNLIPYLLAQLVMFFGAAFIPNGLKAVGADKVLGSATFTFFFPIYQLWFLAAIMIHALVSMKLQPKRHPILFMLAAIAMSLLCGYLPQVNVMRISKSLRYYPFFLLGYLLPKDFMSKLRNKWQYLLVAVFIWMGYLYFLSHEEWWIGFNTLVVLSTRFGSCGPFYGNLPPVLMHLIFLTVVPVISLAFCALCPRNVTIFSKLGQNSMYIFVLHGLVVMAVRCLHYKFGIMANINTPLLKSVYLVFCVLVTFVLGSNRCKRMFKSILQPDVDIGKVIASLNDQYQNSKNRA